MSVYLNIFMIKAEFTFLRETGVSVTKSKRTDMHLKQFELESWLSKSSKLYLLSD